jgi:hypothetical protein
VTTSHRPTRHRPPTAALAVLALGGLLAACASTRPLGDPQEGDAFLRIIGEANVEIGDGAPRTITVRYEDSEGNPLAGEIYFSIVGAEEGAQLSDETVTTDSNGEAHVVVMPPTEVANDIGFEIKAGAVYARDVNWSVLIYSGNVSTLKVAGAYDVESTFDLLEGVPGKLGDLLRDLESMTDYDVNEGHYGIITWALDKLEASDDVGGFVKGIISAMRPELDAAAYHLLEEYAPDWLTGLFETMDSITAYARHFQTISELTIVDNLDGSYTAKHVLKQLVFDDEAPVSLAALGFGDQITEGIAVTVDGRHVHLAMHTFDVSYGELLLYAFNKFIVPRLDSLLDIPGTATNLNDILQGLIPCDDIADWVFGEDASVGASTVEAACRSGVRFLASTMEDKIRGVAGGAGKLNIEGNSTARVAHDGESVEKLQGDWAGTLQVSGMTSELPPPNQTFIAVPKGGVTE